MSLPRQELMFALLVLFVLGGGATAARLLEARRSGLSIRLQVFIPLAATTLVLSAAFAIIVIDRFTDRASVFALRAAEDEARVIAELTSRELGPAPPTLAQAAQRLRENDMLLAFTRGATDTDVAVLDEKGEVLLVSGEARARAGTTLVTAQATVRAGGRALGEVRVRKTTFGMLQLMSDVAPKVGLLAFSLAVASAVLAMIIGGAVANPIERLTRAAQRVAAGERQAPLPAPRGREVRALTRALESMRSELEQRHALESFVANLSHELKNPIASILASAEVLEEGAADEPATARRFAQRIRESADKLHVLTQDLLSLARLESRGIADPPEPANLARLAREALDALGPQAARREVRLELEGPADAEVRGDPLWLRRAIENLIANALQHSPAKGRVRLVLSAAGASWEIAVEDQGGGVDPSIRERLFERFATTRHGAGGTGLGLAIVRAVAELHGGSAELRASTDHGAVFALRLPRG